MAVHGELDRPERRAVAAHLRACDRCRLVWHQELRVKAVIAAIPDLEPPKGLEARLLRIPSTPPPTPGPGFRPTLLGPAGGAALLAAITIGASILVAPRFAGTATHAVASSPAGVSAIAAPPAAAATIVTRNEVARLAFPAPDTTPAASTAAQGRQSQGSERAGPSRPAPFVALPNAERDPARDGERAAIGQVEPRSGDRPDQVGARHESPDAPSAPASEIEKPAAGGAAVPASELHVTPVPATVSPTPATCASLSLHVFADTAGEGPRACGGCDGSFEVADASVAAEMGLTLPVFEVRVIDSASSTLYEGLVVADGASVWVELPELCGSWPLAVRLEELPDGWAACPSSGSLSRLVAGLESGTAVFPLTSGCYEPTPPAALLTPMPTATSLPTETPDPMVTPSAQPGAGGRATALFDPTSTPPAQSDPTRLPTTRPEPAATASPTQAFGIVATPAAHLRRTPTATPILRSEHTPPSWLRPSPTPTPKLRRPGEPLRRGA
jgi:hypothetical protein